MLLAVSSLSNSTDRHDELDWLGTSSMSSRVETWRDEPSGIWAIRGATPRFFDEPRNRLRHFRHKTI